MRPQTGLSLLEVVITASMLALVFIVLMSLFPSALFGVRQAEHRLFAAGLAQAVLDECLAGPFESIRRNGSYTPDSPGPLGELLRRQYLHSSDGTQYFAELYLTDPAASMARDRLALARVRVAWQERSRWKFLERQQQIANLQR